MNTRPPVIDRIAAFAYFRRLPGMDKEAVHQTLKELVAFIERQGLVLSGVFYEERAGDRLRVWCELIAACRTEGVVNVVAPSAENFHRVLGLADFMRQELATTVQGTVWLTDEAGTAATSEAAAHRA